MKKLYKFFWDCGRNGDVEGIFVADEGEINKAVGKFVQFGEILGKHSDVNGILEKDDFTILTEDQDFVSKFQSFLPQGSGYNPLDYLSEEV